MAGFSFPFQTGTGTGQLPADPNDAYVANLIAQDQALRASLEGSGPPPLPPGTTAAPGTAPTVRIGAIDIPVNDVNRLQTEIQRYALAEAERAATAARIATPPVGPTTEPTTPTLPATFPALPTRWDVKTYVTELEKDPVGATDRLLAQALGLDGVGASQAFRAIAQNQMLMAEELKKTQTALETVTGRVEQNSVLSEGERFLASHPEYLPDDANFSILEAYRTRHKLPATADGLDLAYLKARSQGAPLKLRTESTVVAQPPAPNFFNAAPPAPVSPGPRVPSMRPSGSESQPAGWGAMESYLDSLPDGQWQAAVGRFTGGR